jgi:nucleoside-diphosphate-sugar epimerase
MEINADVLITGVTGFVGRFVLLYLMETHPDAKIAVVIRPSGNRSAAERFRTEIVGTSMFADRREQLMHVTVLESAIEALTITGRATRIIHCAANTGHTSVYDILERDNVHNVRRMIRIAGEVGCQSLTLLSTCFVHPRHIQTGKAERVTGVYEDFYNDYTYTKWRGEEVAYEQAALVPQIQLLRLATVVAPLRSDLQMHPHICTSLMTFIDGGHVRSVSVKPKSRVAVVPVDIAAAEIVTRTFEEGDVGVKLAQICPPPTTPAFHVSLSLLADVAHTEFGLKVTKSDTTAVNGLQWYYRMGALLSRKARDTVATHGQLRSLLTMFCDSNVQFESSCAHAFDTQVDERRFVRDLCKYGERMYYEYLLGKRYSLSPGDLFMHRMSENNPVIACLSLDNGYMSTDWPSYKKKLWTAMCAHRKLVGVFDGDEIRTGELVYDAFFGEPYVDRVDIGAMLEDSVKNEKMAYGWKFKPVFNSGHITHLLFLFDHGLTDGAGTIHIIQALNEHVFRGEKVEITIPKRAASMSWWQELVTAVWFLCTLAYTLLIADTATSEIVTQVTADSRPIQKRPGMTFTGDVIWRLMHMLKRKTGQDKHVIVVMVAGGIGSGLLQNNCITVPLPVDASMTEEELARRVGWLRSRAVLFMCVALQWFIQIFHLEGFLDWGMKRFRVILSTLMTPAVPGTAVHVSPNIPKNLTMGVTAVSKDGVANFTVRSNSTLFRAEDAMEALTT